MKINGAYNYREMRTYPKAAINGLTKKLSSFRFGSGSTQQAWSKIESTINQVGLSYRFEETNINGDVFHFVKARKITKEQTQLGKSWLKTHFFKLNGDVRTGKATELVGDRVLRIAKQASRFEFVGVLGLRNSFQDYVQFLPIYRTFDRDGNYFDYAPVHWGQPIIMEGN